MTVFHVIHWTQVGKYIYCNKWVYGNHWIIAWTSDWPHEASTESAAGAQVNAVSLEWPEGMEPGSTSPRPHLRADSQGGKIFIWRSLLMESFCEPRAWVSSLFHCSFLNAIISLVLYLTIWYCKQNLYLFAIHVILKLIATTTAEAHQPLLHCACIHCLVSKNIQQVSVNVSFFFFLHMVEFSDTPSPPSPHSSL